MANPKIDASTLATFASDVVGQQLEKGAKKGYSGFENSSIATLTAQAVAKLLVGNWQSALAYIAMAAAVWYNDNKADKDEQSSS